MTIFAHSETIELFFKDLSNIKNLSNITLVTSQADRTITKKVFQKKPKFINNWYSINALHSHEDLIPIPIGISDSYNLSNSSNKQILNLKTNNIFDKEEKLYLNFRVNTNSSHRSKNLKLLKDKEFVVDDTGTENIENYLDMLTKYKYILCPLGNGIDTYRIWESLIAGSIPVVPNNNAYRAFKHLPIIFYDNPEDLSVKYLENYAKNLDYSNLQEKLTVPYWLKVSDNSTEKKSFIFNTDIKSFTYKRILKSKFKVFRYYIFKYFNLYNYIKFISRLTNRSKHL